MRDAEVVNGVRFVDTRVNFVAKAEAGIQNKRRDRANDKRGKERQQEKKY
jgi:hypothetical protein